MDIYEAAQRLVKRQWAVVLLFLLIGVGIPLTISRLHGLAYVGTARVDMGVDTRSGQQATALADSALGLATSPDVLGAALAKARVHRDVQEMIDNQDVLVTPVGTSGVLDVSVTDASARASAVIANSLATQIVDIRDQAAYGATQKLLTQLQQQSAALSQQIASVVDEAKRSPLPVPGLQQQQADLASQRSSIDHQIQDLAQSLTAANHPRVIDVSSRYGMQIPTGLSTQVPLGALLGLFLGVAVAATREAMRPTLDATSLGRRLGAPVLARLPRARKGTTPLDPWLASYVGAAADADEVKTVQLIPVGKHPADVTDLAYALDDAVEGFRVTALELPGFGGRHRRHAQPGVDRADVGIVVVAPRVLKSKWLAGLEQHLQVTRHPVIGVISYRRRLADIGPAAQGDPGTERRTRGADEPQLPARPPLPRPSPAS